MLLLDVKLTNQTDIHNHIREEKMHALALVVFFLLILAIEYFVENKAKADYLSIVALVAFFVCNSLLGCSDNLVDELDSDFGQTADQDSYVELDQATMCPQGQHELRIDLVQFAPGQDEHERLDTNNTFSGYIEFGISGSGHHYRAGKFKNINSYSTCIKFAAQSCRYLSIVATEGFYSSKDYGIRTVVYLDEEVFDNNPHHSADDDSYYWKELDTTLIQECKPFLFVPGS